MMDFSWPSSEWSFPTKNVLQAEENKFAIATMWKAGFDVSAQSAIANPQPPPCQIEIEHLRSHDFMVYWASKRGQFLRDFRRYRGRIRRYVLINTGVLK